MYEIEFSKTTEKQLSKLNIDVQRRVINSLERIKIRPYHFVKRKEGTNYFIFRVGDYKAILDIKNNMMIYVIEIGHRKNIYK